MPTVKTAKKPAAKAVKPEIIRICRTTNALFEVTEGRKAIQKKVYFSNGETQLKGIWQDTNEAFEAPDCFFHP